MPMSTIGRGIWCAGNEFHAASAPTGGSGGVAAPVLGAVPHAKDTRTADMAKNRRVRIPDITGSRLKGNALAEDPQKPLARELGVGLGRPLADLGHQSAQRLLLARPVVLDRFRIGGYDRFDDGAEL